MSDDAILKTPGEILAEAREAQGRSLAEVAEATKIPVPQLQAIERDEYHRLSGPLYVKSFLRSYADAVDVDVEVVLDLYRRATGEGAARVTEGGGDTWQKETVTISRVGVEWGRLLAWGALGAVVVIVLWLGIRALIGRSGEPSEPAPTPPATAARESLLSREAPADAAGGGFSDVDTLAGGSWPVPIERVAETVANQDQTSGPEAEPAPAATTPEPVAAAPPPAEAKEAAPTAGLPAALATSGPVPFSDGSRWPVRVRLVCREAVSAEARSDGESGFRPAVFGPGDPPPLPGRAIEAGRAYAAREGLVVYWHAADHVGLRLDRTDGVELSVNGKKRDISGLRPGQEIILDAHR
jgi:cytoskeletal protein RodZ